jgi:cell wall-associated NlpC family hydrolase
MSMLMSIALLASSLPNAVVMRPVANMYSSASEDADVVSQAIYGATVGVLAEQDGWLKVRTADEYAGWMPPSSLRRLHDGERPYAATGRVAQVESLFANLYREADVTKRQPLLTVPFETRLEVVAEPEAAGRWLQVRLPDDRPAWIQRGDITLAFKKLTIDETVAFSKRFLGLPYFWGGTSSFGYDCSGFTQMLCRRRGFTIPRDAAPQARWSGMIPVATAELHAGDLLFFGKSADKITHTGMYIGDGKFVHATAHLRPVVQISEIQDPHWTELLVAARRLE